MEFSRIKMSLKIFKMVFPIVLGAIGGYLYYFYVGCNNGCVISGNPYASTIYGAVIGAVFVNWKSGIHSLTNKGEEK